MRRLIRSPAARIVESLGRHAYRAVLPNGHHLTAIVPKRSADFMLPLSIGDDVAIEISPADFSRGLICEILRSTSSGGAVQPLPKKNLQEDNAAPAPGYPSPSETEAGAS